MCLNAPPALARPLGCRPPSWCSTSTSVTNGPDVRSKVKDIGTLPQLFKNNGYRSMRVGKIYHLGIPGGVGTAGPDDPISWDSTVNPKGAEFTMELNSPRPGIKICFVRGPEGVSIEVLERGIK